MIFTITLVAILTSSVSQDQWQRKKQTKEEARQAKMAKLDPDTAMSAKDVLDSRAKKRKRDDEEVSSIDGVEDIEGVEGIDLEKPKQGMKDPDRKKTKKRKQKMDKKGNAKGESQAKSEDIAEEETIATAMISSEQEQGADETPKSKKQLKRERMAAKAAENDTFDEPREVEQSQVTDDLSAKGEIDNEHSPEDGPVMPLQKTDDVANPSEPQPASTATPTPAPDSPNSEQSKPSSTSSVVPSRNGSTDQPKKPMVDSETLRARLRARIEALRAARKADGPDGVRARNRQELIEIRRKKEAQRRAHKKEVRRKAKEEEFQARERALALSRSPDMGSPLATPFSELVGNAYSFGRVAFNDGQQVDATLTGLVNAPRKKGPQDALGAMKAAEAKQARLSGLDEAKRKEIEEKDMWLNAKKRVHGEKVRDDTSLLKKTLKRQDKAKGKSEAEWKERIEGVEKGKEMRQRKREDNLRKRREEKGGGGGAGGGAGKKKKVVKRPGFEGSFRAKPRGSK